MEGLVAERGHDRRLLALSVALQLALGLALGHSYDTRLFMATGFLVGTGRARMWRSTWCPVPPRGVPGDLLGGLPAPLAAASGLLYRGSYARPRHLLLYNFALKLPVIAANVGLAYLVGALLALGSPAAARRAWVVLLFNPFLLYVGRPGARSTLVALLALAGGCSSGAPRPLGRAAGARLLREADRAPLLRRPALPGAALAARRVRYAACSRPARAVLRAPFFALGWDPTRPAPETIVV